jgi:hypothetical protein
MALSAPSTAFSPARWAKATAGNAASATANVAGFLMRLCERRALQARGDGPSPTSFPKAGSKNLCNRRLKPDERWAHAYDLQAVGAVGRLTRLNPGLERRLAIGASALRGRFGASCALSAETVFDRRFASVQTAAQSPVSTLVDDFSVPKARERHNTAPCSA